MGTGGPFPGDKARPGRDADHSPPSSAEVKNEEELYLLSPHAPPWHVAGQLYFFILYRVTMITVWKEEPQNLIHFTDWLTNWRTSLTAVQPNEDRLTYRLGKWLTE
jgi:hypothetical protein